VEWEAFEEAAMAWLEAQTSWKIPRVTPPKPMEPYKAKKKTKTKTNKKTNKKAA